MKNINIYPVLATWKKSKKDGRCPIHVCVDIDNKRISFPSIKRKVLLEEWDEQSKQVRSNALNASLINATIKKFIGDLPAKFLKKELLGHDVTREGIKREMKLGEESQNFYNFCLEQIKLSRYSHNTTRVATHEVGKIKKFRSELCFRDINFDFFQRYESYMRDELQNQTNTIWKSFKLLNGMLNRAVKIGGIIQKNPMIDYDRVRYKQCIPPYLEWHEVLKLKEQLKTNPAIKERCRMVGYYFLLSCTSGLRFSDSIRFNYPEFVIEDSNGRRLILSTVKTGEIVSIIFTKDIAEIVDYLKDKSITITNQEYNRELKILAGITGLSKSLKSHMARHSFGMRCAELGLSEDDVQKLLGHSSNQHTKVYFRIKNNRLDDVMKKWDDNFS